MNQQPHKLSLVVVGGCHVSGYTLKEGESSFVDIIRQTLPVSEIITKSNFKLENVALSEHLISHNQADFFIIQLGNNEFCPSFKEIFHMTTMADKKDEPQYREPFKGSHHSFLFDLLLWILSPVRWLYSFWKNHRYLHVLLAIIKKYPAKNFIVLSPFPRYNLNYSRWRAKLYYRHLYKGLENVQFVDVFKVIPTEKGNFNDLIHLSSRGHFLLGKAISHEIRKKIILSPVLLLMFLKTSHVIRELLVS